MVDTLRPDSAARSRRADILAAAEREFVAAGFFGARIERIAAAARVNKQLLFHYFGSKDGLFAAALEGLLSRADAPDGPGDDPAGAMRRILSQVEAAARASPGLVALLADANANDAFPAGAASLIRDWRRRLLERIVTVMADGQRRGYYRDDLDPAQAARLALAAALGAGAMDPPAAPSDLAGLVSDYCAWR